MGLYHSVEHPVLVGRHARQQQDLVSRVPPARFQRLEPNLERLQWAMDGNRFSPSGGRKVVCPETYATRLKANGDLECWKLPPECPKPIAVVGNPITLLDGCKVQRELDYRSHTPGGVEVERFYNSGGYFRFDTIPKRASDVWRTTWDRRIAVAPTPGAVLAYAQRADGSVLAFGSSGREMQNNQGGGSALLQKIADAAGATSGWRLTTAELDIETYDASGRLTAVALRTGKSYQLSYDGGRLAAVTDTFGAAVTFAYDGSGRLSGFVAPGNRVYAYGYDAAGRLTSVTYPDNAVRTYHYEDANFVHALTGITDENGARYATWAYDAGQRPGCAFAACRRRGQRHALLRKLFVEHQ
jgi:YD repeat-containing protein